MEQPGRIDGTLIDGGIVRADVVSPAGAPAAVQYAAEELRRHLHQMAGSPPMLRREPEGPILYVSDLGSVRPDDPVPSGLTLASEEFHLATRHGRVLILGGGPRGTLYGVYELLERLGCRWFTPDVSHVPRYKKLRLDPLEETGSPAFEFRDTFCWDCGDPVWWARNRLNGWYVPLPGYLGGSVGYGLFVHTFYRLMPPSEFFSEHPEYFSLIDGQRRHERGQLCLSNPEVLRIVTERVLEEMRRKPEATIFSVSQNDWAGYCECPECTAIAEAEASQAGPVLRFVNAVAERTAHTFPGKLIDTLAYQYTLEAPRQTVPHPNVRVRLCPIKCCQGHSFGTCDHPESQRFLKALEDWGQLTDQMYIWHYCTNFAHYPLPMPDFDELAENIRLYDRLGVHGVFMQGMGGNGGGAESMALRGYVISKLLWNPQRPVWPIVDEFLAAVYGKAAADVRCYLNMFHERVRRDRTVHPSLYDPPTHPLFDGDILQRADAALTDGALRVRGDKRRRTELLRGGVRYAKLYKTCGVFKREGDVFSGDATTEDLAQFDELVKLWKRAGVEHLREGRPLSQSVTQIRNRLRVHEVEWLRWEDQAIGVVPTLGGRILEWHAHGRQWLAPPDPENHYLLYPMSGGYFEYAHPSEYSYLGWGEPYRKRLRDAKLNLSLLLPDGLRLSRTYGLSNGVVRIESRLKNRSRKAQSVAWGASVQLRLPNWSAVHYESESRPRSLTEENLPDGLEHARILEGPALPDGKWSATAPDTAIEHRFKTARIGRVICGRKASTDLVALDLRTERVRLEPGKQIVMWQELEIRRR